MDGIRTAVFVGSASEAESIARQFVAPLAVDVNLDLWSEVFAVSYTHLTLPTKIV